MPKDLINLGNLDNVIAKLLELQNIVIANKSFTVTGTNVIAGVTFNPTQNLDRNYDLNNPLAVIVTNFPSSAVAGTTYNPTQNMDRNYDQYIININTLVGDPNAIAEALDQYLQGAIDRGTLRLR